MVHDDTLEIADDIPAELLAGPLTASITSLPPPTMRPPRLTRTRSNASEFPPPKIRRVSTDGAGFVRPVPFSAKFQRVHPGTTGVTVLEHMERLDRVEASLERLVAGDDEQSEEQDVGELVRPASISSLLAPPEALAGTSSAPSRAGVQTELSPVPEGGSSGEASVHEDADEDEDAEEDVAALSKSLPQLEGSLSAHGHWTSHMSSVEPRNLDWMQDEPVRKRTVITERLELIEKKALLSCW